MAYREGLRTGLMDEAEYRFYMAESPVPTLEISFRYGDGSLAGVALVVGTGYQPRMRSACCRRGSGDGELG